MADGFGDQGSFCLPRFRLHLLSQYLSSSNRSITSHFFTLLALSLSFWIGINGVVFGQYNLGICTSDNYALESLCWYVPEFSALFRPFVVSKKLSSGDLTIIIFSFTVFIYLSMPVFYQLVNKLISKGKEFKILYLNFDKWEF